MTSSPAYSPWEPALGWSEIPAKPVISASHCSNCWKMVCQPRACRSGANGCRRLSSGQVIGNISAAAFSFMVQEPSGIMDVANERSRDSSRFR